MAVVGPQWIGRNVGHDDRLFSIDGGAARSGARPDLRAVNGLNVFLGKTGSSPMSQRYTVSVKKKNTATTAIVVFNEANSM